MERMVRPTCYCELTLTATSNCGVVLRHSERPVVPTRPSLSSTSCRRMYLLTSLLPLGTVTCEHYNGSTCSTIDISLANHGLSEACEYCGIHQNDHGTDHKAIRAHVVVGTTGYQKKRRKRMYDKADWETIREEVSKRIADDSSLLALSTKGDLEVAMDKLEASVNGVLEEHVARVRPSPCAKRWWTDEL